MASGNDLSTQQLAFAAHLRNPEQNPAPEGIEDRRLKIYRDLFLGNLSSLLASSFPVLRNLYGDDQWRRLMRKFFADHRCHTPIFAEVPGEFLAFLTADYQPADSDFPFLIELAHYEWAELALSTSDQAIPWDSIDRRADLLTGPPVVSPLAWSLTYQYPVHRISPDFIPETPGSEPTRLLVYRDLADKVGFIQINLVTARLLELAENNPRRKTGEQLLGQIAIELAHPNPDTVRAGGQEILERLHRRDAILGTRLD